MEQLKTTLDPLINSLPTGVQNLWLLVVVGVALVVLSPIIWYQRRLLGELVTGRRELRPRLPEPEEEDLATFPPPPGPTGVRRLMVEGVPARLRLVVIAPLGTVASVDDVVVNDLLNQLLWGLGNIAAQDQPVVRIWPPQLSAHGFGATFHRKVRKPEADDEPSRWVLVAGPTPPRPRPVLVGLGLLTDSATTIGRIAMRPSQWVTLLHMQSLEPLAAAVAAPREPVPDPVTDSGSLGPRGSQQIVGAQWAAPHVIEGRVVEAPNPPPGNNEHT
jgi:hypothetical protein